MKTRIGINGFGRIGRSVFRVLNSRDDIEIVAINDIFDKEALTYLLKYDTVMGRFPSEVSLDGDMLKAGQQNVKLIAERVPSELPWGELGVDIVVESTGIFRQREQLEQHLSAGCKKVVLTVPAKDAIDYTVVLGVNDSGLKSEHKIVSNASCTTNCLAPMAKVLNENFGIQLGVINTIHAYTNDQRLADVPHSDWRRSRAAAENVIPTTTGAARAVGVVLPELNGKLDGSALRVPTPNVSAVDLTFEASNPVTVEDVNSLVKYAANNDMVQVLAYDSEPKVSIDFNHTTHSCIFAPDQTKVVGKHTVRVLAWYDNEWAFSCRMADVASTMGRLL